MVKQAAPKRASKAARARPDATVAKNLSAETHQSKGSGDAGKLKARIETLEQQLEEAKISAARLRSSVLYLENALKAITRSTSWRLTAPVRALRLIMHNPGNVAGYLRKLARGDMFSPPVAIGQGTIRLRSSRLREIRKLFDEDVYLDNNPDVELAGLEPFQHFLDVGYREGRIATRETDADIKFLRGGFDPAYYAAANPDVADAGLEPFRHYVEIGRWEGREPRAPDLPPGQYAAKVGSGYYKWIAEYDANEDSLATLKAEIDVLSSPPRISVVMPVYNTPEPLLRAAIDSVVGQIYPHWELCIADDHSTDERVHGLLREYAERDPRIKVVFRERNGHISEASNSAFALATGEWAALLDHDDLLRSDSLAEVALEIARHQDAQIIYTDEDKLDDELRRFDPYFKPDYSPELFRSQNYFNHLTVHRSDNIRAVGGWRKGFEGSQDYDLNLRIIERIAPDTIRHIPKVLYHWRAVKGSTAAGVGEKDYAYEAGLNALKEHVGRLGFPAEVAPATGAPYYRVTFRAPEPQPLVSLIIPAKDKAKLTKGCISSILDKTTYRNFEILLIDNNSVESKTRAYNREIAAHPQVRVISYTEPFNYSAINNFAAREAKGTILGLVNNDIEVIDGDWLREMVSWAAQPDIGCVGAKLLYADRTVQHAGVVLGVGGVADHSYRGLKSVDGGYFGQALVLRNASAVTAACLLVRKSVFDEVGGLDEESLKIAFNDIDLCLKVREAGYRNVWTPYAELFHLESQSRGYEDNPEKIARFQREIRAMRRRWGRELDNDPYYSPNLSRRGPPYAFAP